jgi:hypothetical protein
MVRVNIRLNYHHSALVAILTNKYSRVLTDNYYLAILDHGQKIFYAPLARGGVETLYWRAP